MHANPRTVSIGTTILAHVKDTGKLAFSGIRKTTCSYHQSEQLFWPTWEETKQRELQRTICFTSTRKTPLFSGAEQDQELQKSDAKHITLLHDLLEDWCSV